MKKALTWILGMIDLYDPKVVIVNPEITYKVYQATYAIYSRFYGPKNPRQVMEMAGPFKCECDTFTSANRIHDSRGFDWVVYEV